MKHLKMLIATVLVLNGIVQNPCSAQSTETRPRIGLKGGINFSNLYTKDADKSEMLIGFNAGLFGKFPIINRVALQPELYYTTKGSNVTYDNLFVKGTATFRLNYIELPLLLVVNITENFNIHAGPFVSYLINGTVKNKSNVTLFDFEDNIDTGDYNRLEAGIAVGAGIDIKAISIGARYNYGMTTVGKEKTFLGTSYTFPDAKTGVINLYISLAIN